jgi:hypothetical protein
MSEGTRCLRPAHVLASGNGLFELLPTKDYHSKVENWELLAGSFIHATTVDRDGGRYLLAVSFES